MGSAASTGQPGQGPDGLVVVDKPGGLTSHDVVARARKALSTRRVGHAGTLDPMATGVLVLGVGRGTKLLTYLVGVDKTYQATIRLGWATTTDDAEGEPGQAAPPDSVDRLTREQVLDQVPALTGAIDQVPSTVSAIKIDGRRAHALVRAGQDVQLASRQVTVHRFDVRQQRSGVAEHGTYLELDVEVDCSSGTYIRALARDLGVALGVGGHLTALRRTRVGPFDHTDATALEQFAADPQLMPLAEGARRVLPSRQLTAQEAAELRFGRRIASLGLDQGPTAGFAPDGALVAVLTQDQHRAHPVLVLDPA